MCGLCSHHLGEYCPSEPLGARELHCQAQKVTQLNKMSSYQCTSRKERNKGTLKNGPLVIQLLASLPAAWGPDHQGVGRTGHGYV